MHAFSVVVPRTVLQVLQELTPGKDGTPKIKAGGVDLLDLMKEGMGACRNSFIAEHFAGREDAESCPSFDNGFATVSKRLR